VSWKELQHTGVCLRNIHQNTNAPLLREFRGASPVELRRRGVDVWWWVYAQLIIRTRLQVHIIFHCVFIDSPTHDLEYSWDPDSP
jgi:hypothetical protein